MSKFKIFTISSGIIFIIFIMLLVMNQHAFADPEPTVRDDRSPATTSIPFVHTMNAGATADLSDITYTISITGTAKEDGTLGSYASTGIAPLTLPFTNGVITPATPDPTIDAERSSDATKVWGDSKTLAQLFGSDDKSNTDTDTGYLKFSTNFPQAGIYKFTISETRAGADSSKWKYEPWNTAEDRAGTYTLVVFIANDTGANANVAERHYDGWYLIDNVTGDKVAINTADNAESGVDFTSTYKATSTLNVTKHVSGDYASTTFPFPQTITLTLPDWAADEDVEAIAPDGTTIAPVSGTGTATRIYNVELKHNDIVSFTVPVGTRYTVDETRLTDGAGLNYQARIDWTVDDGIVRYGLKLPLSNATLDEDGVTFRTEHATFTVTSKATGESLTNTPVPAGEEVVVKVTPESDYELDKVTVTETSNGNELATSNDGDENSVELIMPNGTIDIEVETLKQKSLSDYSLADLSFISADIGAKGNSSEFYDEFVGYMNEGQTISFNLQNLPTTDKDGSTIAYADADKVMHVRIIGIQHDTATTGGKTGLTFQATHALPVGYRMKANYTSIGGWRDSELRTTMNSGAIWNMMPTDLQNAIIAVDKVSGTDNRTRSASSVATTSDKLFVPSHYEILGTHISELQRMYPNEFAELDNSWLTKEGYQYEWYASNVTSYGDNIALVRMNETNSGESFVNGNGLNVYIFDCWERSADFNTALSNSDPFFLAYGPSGNPGYSFRPDYALGILPCFCI